VHDIKQIYKRRGIPMSTTSISSNPLLDRQIQNMQTLINLISESVENNQQIIEYLEGFNVDEYNTLVEELKKSLKPFKKLSQIVMDEVDKRDVLRKLSNTDDGDNVLDKMSRQRINHVNKIFSMYEIE
jgi:hypothetical protein